MSNVLLYLTRPKWQQWLANESRRVPGSLALDGTKKRLQNWPHTAMIHDPQHSTLLTLVKLLWHTALPQPKPGSHKRSSASNWSSEQVPPEKRKSAMKGATRGQITPVKQHLRKGLCTHTITRKHHVLLKCCSSHFVALDNGSILTAGTGLLFSLRGRSHLFPTTTAFALVTPCQDDFADDFHVEGQHV